MKSIRNFVVVPRLPEKLARLKEIAFNLWWCWNPDALQLFRRLDTVAWENCYHNPVKMLGNIPQEKLEAFSNDEGFLAQLDRVYTAFRHYMNDKQTWYSKKYGFSEKPVIAYFSAEFGIAESVPIYSGGLGMLAGDHLKSASDLGLPLVGIGMLYRVGYFQQYLNAAGWQQERYPANDFFNMPIEMVRNEKGDPLTVTIQFPERTLYIQIWRIEVGRVTLLALDTDTPLNSPHDRKITGELYGGDIETRIQQETVLGIGGLRALHAMNFHPTTYHMNEGHSAFLALERIRVAMERHQMSFHEGLELTRSSNLFTTHTPVPAGIDVFNRELMERYFGYFAPKLGISMQEFLDIGWAANTPKGPGFSMAVCALNLSAHANGVSKLHGEVSREMWRDLYPHLPAAEVPISSITNGVHIRSYISQELSQLYDRYLGPRWINSPEDQTVWKQIDTIPPEELWRTHERRRERLVAFARSRLVEQLQRRGAPPSEIAAAKEVLSPEALTIGFARRFATYKRATLLFKDLERLVKILCSKDRPVQIIIAGKAHPKDEPAKQFIKDIIAFTNNDRLRRHVVFIENYDVVVARYLVQGVDVWLNNPRRPLEASGTSGMKAAANGVLNLSVLDGWWDEGYQAGNGWAIGHGEEYKDPIYHDEVEANALYELLEKDVVPLFYERAKDGLPRRWIDMMKQAISQLAPVFNTHRMVAEYTDKYYVTGGERYKMLSANDRIRAREVAGWLRHVKNVWPNLKIESVETAGGTERKVGDEVEVTVKMFLDQLIPSDIQVEAYYGPIGADEKISPCRIVKLIPGKITDRRAIFSGKIKFLTSGKLGLTVRALPDHPDLVNPIVYRLMLWA
ncbi:MAG: alpha-glucan family phosphorylase [Candidatus Riflebacteria bacterium]|nr:alpha-glucan family phosphorylase [Candidatus Riflebacteria bacterium]